VYNKGGGFYLASSKLNGNQPLWGQTMNADFVKPTPKAGMELPLPHALSRHNPDSKITGRNIFFTVPPVGSGIFTSLRITYSGLQLVEDQL
jgi:hypothetical protein